MKPLTPRQITLIDLVGMLHGGVARDELSVAVALRAAGWAWLTPEEAREVIEIEARIKAGLWPFPDDPGSAPTNLDATIAIVEREITRQARGFGHRSRWVDVLYHLRHYRMKISQGRLV